MKSSTSLFISLAFAIGVLVTTSCAAAAPPVSSTSQAAAGPQVTSISPASTVGSGPGFSLTTYGLNFSGKSVVLWNGSSRPTVVISTSQLVATISSADIASVGTAQVS